MISPSISFWFVRALNCLQNSMMLICAWPSAGPTGGAGVALPAAICNLTKPVTFFAMISLPSQFPSLGFSAQDLKLAFLLNWKLLCLSHLLHLVELQLHRGRAAEDRHHDFQRLAIFIHFVHNALERSERPFRNAHGFVLLELDLQLGLLAAVRNFVNDVLHFLVGKRRWLP